MPEEYYDFIREIQRLNNENEALKRYNRVWVMALYEINPNHNLFGKLDEVTREAIEREIKRNKPN